MKPTSETPFKAKEEDKVIVCIGKSGSEKSNIIDCLRRVQNSSEQWSQKRTTPILTPVRSVRLVDPNTLVEVVLVDTPGFDLFDDGLQDVEKMIVEWVKTCYSANKRPAGILYLQPILDTRSHRNLAVQHSIIIRKLCDPENVVFVTTRWDELGPEKKNVGRARQLEVETHWNSFARKGAIFAEFDNQNDIAWEILRRLLVSRNMAAQLGEDILRFGNESKEQSWAKGLSLNVQPLIEREAANNIALSSPTNDIRQLEQLKAEQARIAREMDRIAEELAVRKQSFVKRTWDNLSNFLSRKFKRKD